MNFFQFLKKNVLILILVLSIFAGFILESDFIKAPEDIDVHEIEQSIIENEQSLSIIIEDVLNSIDYDNPKIWLSDNFGGLINPCKDNEFIYLVYENDTLIYWSNNRPIIPDYKSELLHNKILFLGNGWYQSIIKEKKDITIVGLALLKREYSINNPLLVDYFANNIDLNSDDIISLNPDEGDNIYFEKEYLFSVIKSEESSDNILLKGSAAFLYFFSISILLILLVLWLSKAVKYKIWMRSFVFVIIVAAIRWVLIYFEIPNVFYEFSLFQPHYFAESELFSSLGNFLLNSVFILTTVFFCYKLGWDDNNQSVFKKYGRISSVFSFFALTIFFAIIELLIRSLIINSTITFEVHKIFDVTFSTFIGFVIISFLILSFLLLLDKVITISQKSISVKYLMFLSFIFALIYTVSSFIYDAIICYSGIFLFVFFIATIFIRKRGRKPVYSTLIFYLFASALFTVLIIINTNIEKEDGRKEVIAVNLANERDPLAETFLDNIENQMLNDSILYEMMFSENADIDEMYSHISKQYFTGYWNKYDLQLFLCGSSDSILNEMSNESFLCYDFFDEIIESHGINIPNTKFFFIDNMNGRISYLGEIDFIHITDSSRLSLFVDINTVMNSRLLGYPELLLNKPVDESDILSDYSYSKYKDGVLVSRFGDFEYSLSDKIYKSDQEFSILHEGGYDHLIYCFVDDITIIVSSVSVTFLDYLIMLSYIFVFFHIIFTIVIFIYRFPNQFVDFRFDFKNKIQFTMISILFLSLFMIGGGTIYFNIKQYSEKQLDSISEKIQSVLIELEHKLANEEELNYEFQEYLTYLLVKFSNVFYTDINVYNIEGNLLASSRGEIFDNSLISTKMNSEAFRQIHDLKKGRYVHEEQIGEMKYLSVYAPFSNNRNKVLAYLNLPYFTNQKLLHEEVFGLITAIINIYVFLVLLTILITIFITNKITQPLKLIRDKMHVVKLGKDNEKIIYNSKDEIGSLIDDYNRMIDELQNSADLLMKSERESAWREMAKQIAHEIKNPLTPMRLQLQHLQKAKSDNAPDWDEKFMRISDVIINQIDALSAISSEFSNFAQMPRANNQKMNLVESLNEIISLFNEDDKENITINSDSDVQYFVFADKEELQRVFINLIKNAIQSIPEGIRPEIRINLIRKSEEVIVEIKDNGKGVPDELKDKLFQPSFTTKTSGTGLGLAIVKRIVESIGGRIWFETKHGRGSSFFVAIPDFVED